jgi:hypothetical protein
VIKYTGKDKSKSEGEIEGKKGYAVGFRGMLKYIMDRLPKEEKFEGGKKGDLEIFRDGHPRDSRKRIDTSRFHCFWCGSRHRNVPG